MAVVLRGLFGSLLSFAAFEFYCHQKSYHRDPSYGKVLKTKLCMYLAGAIKQKVTKLKLLIKFHKLKV